MKRKINGFYFLSCLFGLIATATFAAPSPAHLEVIGAVSASKIQAGNSLLGITSSETDTLVQTNNDFRHWNSWGLQMGLGLFPRCYIF